MTHAKLHRLTLRALKAAKAFRAAAIDADAAIHAFAPKPGNLAARRLVEVSELSTLLALDAVQESDRSKR